MLSNKIMTLGLSIAAAGLAADAHGAAITMTGNDPSGTSSFTSGQSWPGGVAPSAGNTYLTGANQIRSRNDGGQYTFQGNSLSIDTGGTFLIKANNQTHKDTVNLILNGGIVNQAVTGGDGAVTTLAGTIAVNAASTVGALGGEGITIDSTISGSAGLTFGGAFNGGLDSGVITFTAANTYTGTTTIANSPNGYLPAGGPRTVTTLRITGIGRIGSATSVADVIVNAGTLLDIQNSSAISDYAALKVTSGSAAEISLANGVNETVNQLFLNGVQLAAGTYGSSTSSATNQNNAVFTGSGILTVVPEPSALGVLLVGANGLLARRRGRRMA